MREENGCQCDCAEQSDNKSIEHNMGRAAIKIVPGPVAYGFPFITDFFAKKQGFLCVQQ